MSHVEAGEETVLCTLAILSGCFYATFPVVLKAENLLVLSDVAFMKDVANYFQTTFTREVTATPEPLEDEPSPSLDEEDLGLTLVAPSLPATSTVSAPIASSPSSPAEDKLVAILKSLPRIKVDVSVKDFRVAVIEDVDADDPQALTLKVHVY